MRLAIFSTKKWVRDAFSNRRPPSIEVTFFEAKLDRETAPLAAGYEGVCVFVNDVVDAPVVDILAELGVQVIALRCAGFNNVDIRRAAEKGLLVCRVPSYSPYSVAEHALGLIMSLNRRYHRAYARVREGDFSLDGLMGFDVHGKTVGVVGTGKIGQIFINLMKGFGTKILAYDKFPNEEVSKEGVEYVPLPRLYRESHIVSLHCPLTKDTHHLIDREAVAAMRQGVMIINTSRGPLIDSAAVIDGLKSKKIAYLGLDVYEEEGDLFFEDLSDEVIQDDTFVRLQTFPNVLITGHQAFFTAEAVEGIRDTTYANLAAIDSAGTCENLVELGIRRADA